MGLNYQIVQISEQAMSIVLGDQIDELVHHRVVQTLAVLEQHQLVGVIEYVPAYCTITVHYNPWMIYKQIRHKSNQMPSAWLKQQIELILNHFNESEYYNVPEGRVVEIPVCYGGIYGPDLNEVARYNDITPEEVIAIHSKTTYFVHMLGFAPGFPYLGGMDKKIAMPRKAIPRAVIEAGSVGIAGEQTGIYSISTPGGWRIIGRTPLTLFHPEYEVPTLIQAGDRIKFIPIDKDQFHNIGSLNWT